jgi:hypothetical protein
MTRAIGAAAGFSDGPSPASAMVEPVKGKMP